MLALQRHARESGGDVQELTTLYVLEALLARIAASAYRNGFVLKGGVLLAAFAARRPTKDVDLEALRLNNDADSVLDRLDAVLDVHLADGVDFDRASVRATTIREQAAYVGVRVRLVATLGRARITVGVDVNFGDPIVPEPALIDIPPAASIRDAPVRLLGYPLTMVFAEKIVTAVERGEANTRWRDFADVYVLIGRHGVDAGPLRTGLESVAAYRKIELTPLLPALENMPTQAQSKWRAWRRRVGREGELPERFADVLAAVAAFADPVSSGRASGAWDPASRTWPASGA